MSDTFELDPQPREDVDKRALVRYVDTELLPVIDSGRVNEWEALWELVSTVLQELLQRFPTAEFLRLANHAVNLNESVRELGELGKRLVELRYGSLRAGAGLEHDDLSKAVEVTQHILVTVERAQASYHAMSACYETILIDQPDLDPYEFDNLIRVHLDLAFVVLNGRPALLAADPDEPPSRALLLIEFEEAIQDFCRQLGLAEGAAANGEASLERAFESARESLQSPAEDVTAARKALDWHAQSKVVRVNSVRAVLNACDCLVVVLTAILDQLDQADDDWRRKHGALSDVIEAGHDAALRARDTASAAADLLVADGLSSDAGLTELDAVIARLAGGGGTDESSVDSADLTDSGDLTGNGDLTANLGPLSSVEDFPETPETELGSSDDEQGSSQASQRRTASDPLVRWLRQAAEAQAQFRGPADEWHTRSQSLRRLCQLYVREERSIRSALDAWVEPEDSFGRQVQSLPALLADPADFNGAVTIWLAMWWAADHLGTAMTAALDVVRALPEPDHVAAAKTIGGLAIRMLGVMRDVLADAPEGVLRRCGADPASLAEVKGRIESGLARLELAGQARELSWFVSQNPAVLAATEHGAYAVYFLLTAGERNHVIIRPPERDSTMAKLLEVTGDPARRIYVSIKGSLRQRLRRFAPFRKNILAVVGCPGGWQGEVRLALNAVSASEVRFLHPSEVEDLRWVRR